MSSAMDSSDPHGSRRSPSVGHTNYSADHNYAAPSQPLSLLDPSNFDSSSLGFDDAALHSRSTLGAFTDPTFTNDYQQQAQSTLGPTYAEFQQEQHQRTQPQLLTHSSNFSDQSYGHFNGLSSQDSGQYSSQGSNHVSPSTVTNDSSAFPSFDFDQVDFNTQPHFNQNGFDQNGSLDPTLLDSLNGNGSDMNAKLLDPMSSTLSSHSPTPPHLVPDMGVRRHSKSPSPQASPGFQQASSFPNMDNRQRNLSESLDPSSAMFPQGQGNEWSAMGAYRGAHRRTPSDNYSDVSSTQNSPYLGNLDSFDANAQSSPMLNPTSDPSFGSDLGMQGFSLGDNHVAPQQNFNGYSPGHSPQPSPRLSSQQAVVPNFDNYGLNLSMDGQFTQLQQNSLGTFTGGGKEPFPTLNGQQSPGGEIGLADQMSPPEINIDFAPPSGVPVEQVRSIHGDDTLSPPQRTNRTRSKSDSQASSRPSTPGFISRGRSPSLQNQQRNTLSPLYNGTGSATSSRSQSPARGRNGSLGSRHRSHSASENRDYILDLADPERSPSNTPSGRVQKHPATFQCTLCPKRFTRAYNLRSHLRTHTDERPFVCTVCGKAFARQHDRKRHEGLHTGEKKFVCRGTLQNGPQWGCGRRFARADALGRHFRSEAGRVCIKPLLDEEAAERQKTWMQEQQQQSHLTQQQQGMGGAPQSMLSQPHLDPLIANFLPQALLQQYPDLAGLDWNSIPQGPPPEEGDISGRSSFDASSGGEFYDEMSENEMSSLSGPSDLQHMNGLNMHNGITHQQQQQLNFLPNNPIGASGAPYGGNRNPTTGDYLGDFEGR